jgi:hypothetical protein
LFYCNWGNLFEEKVPPNPFQNLFGLLLPFFAADMMKREKRGGIFGGVRLKIVRAIAVQA